MCLIIHAPGGTEVPGELLESGLGNNPDGWGIVQGPRAVVGLYDSTFYREFAELDPSLDRWVHFRYATHGRVSQENCHPFLVQNGDRNYWVMHNGVIPGIETKGSNSDTAQWCLDVLPGLLPIFGTDEFHARVRATIGASKMAIIREDGDHVIVGRALGVEHDGLWLSNGYSLTRNIQADEDDFDVLEMCSDEEIEWLCEHDPAYMAQLIRRHFDEEKNYPLYHGWSDDEWEDSASNYRRHFGR
jgi:glutamine amidotransferase